MMVLSAHPDIEIVCTDSRECFDDNKAFLVGRLHEEQNPQVRKLLKKDVDFLDQKHVCTNPGCMHEYLITDKRLNEMILALLLTADIQVPTQSTTSMEIRRMEKEIERQLESPDARSLRDGNEKVDSD